MSRRGWLLFAAMCVIWGIPYLLIKVAVSELSPAMLVLARTGIAAALLLPIAALRSELRPLLTYWRPLLVFAAIEIAIPWMLLGVAEQRISSSLTGLLIAAVPLFTALIVRTTGGRERLGTQSVIGLVLGFVGVAAIVGVNAGSAGFGPIVAMRSSRSATRSGRTSCSATWPACPRSASSWRRSRSPHSSTFRSRRSACLTSCREHGCRLGPRPRGRVHCDRVPHLLRTDRRCRACPRDGGVHLRESGRGGAPRRGDSRRAAHGRHAHRLRAGARRARVSVARRPAHATGGVPALDPVRNST